MSEIASEVEDRIALIRLVRPGGNALLPALRAGLMRALENAAQDDRIDAIVMTGTVAAFSNGLDLREYDMPPVSPTVGALARAIEMHSKPIVAAINGSALEAGFELALAAHARVAREGAKVSLPQVALGMVPSGGATQRLPRMVGARAALELLLNGRAMSVGDERLAPLFHTITSEVPLRQAQALARVLADRGTWQRSCDARAGLSNPAAYQAAVTAAAQRIAQRQRDGAGRDLGAEGDVVRCVEAAQLLPFEQGLALEQDAAEARRASPTARARRHLFAVERRAMAQISALGPTPQRPQTIALIGQDARIPVLAAACLDRAGEVILYAPDVDAAHRIADRAALVLEAAAERGRLAPDQLNAYLDKLSLSDDPAVLGGADLVLDAGGPWTGPVGVPTGAVWCVLDDTTPAVEQARRTGAETVTVRPYRPAYAASLAEIEWPEEMRPASAALVARLFADMGRSVLVARAPLGMLGHTLMAAGFSAALMLVHAGAAPAAVERGARQLGFRTGFLDMIDREGAKRVLARLARQFPECPGTDWLTERVQHMEAHWPGAGALYSQGTEGRVLDPDLGPWLHEWRVREKLDDQPTLDLPDRGYAIALHAALVNRAAALMHDGRLPHPEMADFCCVRGYGMDRDRGGVLLQADMGQLLLLVRAMTPLARLSPIWAPEPRLTDMLKNGTRFFPVGLGQAG